MDTIIILINLSINLLELIGVYLILILDYSVARRTQEKERNGQPHNSI